MRLGIVSVLGEVQLSDIGIEVIKFFDVIYFRASLHYVYNPRETLNRAKKYLKRNGLIVIFTTSRSYWGGKLIRCSALIRSSTQLNNPGYNFFFDERSLIRLVGEMELIDKFIPYWGSGYESFFDFPQLFHAFIKKRFLSLVKKNKYQNIIGPA